MKLTFKPIDDNAKQGQTVLLMRTDRKDRNNFPFCFAKALWCKNRREWIGWPWPYNLPTHYCEVEIEVQDE